MPLKLTADKVSQKLLTLREHVEQHAGRLKLRSGDSVREKLDKRFSTVEYAWYNFLVRHYANLEESHRQQLSHIFACIDGGTPTASIGGVNARGGFFYWRIQGPRGAGIAAEGPERETVEEAEADGETCNATASAVHDPNACRDAVRSPLITWLIGSALGLR